jgi:Amidohydrolase family
MKKGHFLSFIIINLILIYSCEQPKDYFHVTNGLFIENATIITADSTETVNQFKGHIILQADTILSVSNKKPLLKGTYETINAEGKYVIPGLIDSHVHVGHPIGISDSDWETKPKLVESYFNQLPKSYLYFGYTTLIDLDTKERAKNQFNSQPIKPRIYSTGPGIRNFDGYGQSLFPKPLRYKIFSNWVYNQSQKDNIPEQFPLFEHSVENVIKNVLQTNPIGIKTYHESGFGVFNWPVPTDSILKQIVSYGNSHKLPVILHSTSAESYQAGLRTNVDIFAHGLWHWENKILNAEPNIEIHDIMKQIAARKKYVQLTTRVLLGEYEDYKWQLIDHPEIENVLPSNLIEHMKTFDGQFAKRTIADRYNSLKPDKSIENEVYFQYGIDKIRNTTKLTQDYGVKILFGTDTPSAEGIGNPPGLNGFLEMKSLFEFGVSLKEIFLASTIRNATAFNLQHELGSVDTKKRADLIILKHNPLKSIEAYNTIEEVISKGRRYSRIEFSANHE